MEQILTKNDNKVDAVVASNDGTAGGADRRAGGAGHGRRPCRFRVRTAIMPRSTASRSARRRVSVWKDARELGKKAAEIAALLADGKKMSEIPGVVKFAGGPKKIEMNSLFLTPIPITKDNLDVVIDAGWIKKDEVCQGVKPGTVKVCD